MEKAKRLRLEKKGWKVGTVSEFLGLTLEEEALIEIKLALSRSLRQRREPRMSLADLADKIKTSEPKLAKAENGEPSVPMDLLVKAILATGATPQDIGKAIAKAQRRSATAST